MATVTTHVLEEMRTRPRPEVPKHFLARGPLLATCYEFRRPEGKTELANETTYSAVLVVRAFIGNKHLANYPGLKPSETEEYEYRIKVAPASKSQLDRWIQGVVLKSLTPQNNNWVPVSALIGITTRDLEAEGYKIIERSPGMVDVRWPTRVISD